MTNEEIVLTRIGIVVGVAAIIAAIVIAWFQGVFRRVRAQVLLGPSKGNAPPWAAFIVVPDLPVTHYVVGVPFAVANTGGEAVRAVRLQVRHDKAVSVLNLNHPKIDLYKQLANNPGILRRDYVFDDIAISDYEFDILRRGETLLLPHLVAIPKTLLFASDPFRVCITRFNTHIAAENSRLKEGEAFVVCSGRTGYDPEIGQRMAVALHEKLRSLHRDRPKVVWKWRNPDKPLETRAVIDIDPRWIVSREGVAFEAQLNRGEATSYISSQVNVVDLSSWASRRRPQVRE